ncbi:MAG: hypothetical protein ACFN9G_09275 [Cardiobacterium sp.]
MKTQLALLTALALLLAAHDDNRVGILCAQRGALCPVFLRVFAHDPPGGGRSLN